MSDWRVDPDGVLGVLAGVDELGPEFESAHTNINDAALAGGSMSVDGRTALQGAWEEFMSLRSLVPGKLMWSVSRASSSVGRATTEIVVGSVDMAAATQNAQQYAEDEWGIGPSNAYYTADVSVGGP